jgi:hypothetical protein
MGVLADAQNSAWPWSLRNGAHIPKADTVTSMRGIYHTILERKQDTKLQSVPESWWKTHRGECEDTSQDSKYMSNGRPPMCPPGPPDPLHTLKGRLLAPHSDIHFGLLCRLTGRSVGREQGPLVKKVCEGQVEGEEQVEVEKGLDDRVQCCEPCQSAESCEQVTECPAVGASVRICPVEIAHWADSQALGLQVVRQGRFR